MLSPGVAQMLDRVRAEFGVDIDVLDPELSGTWNPDAPHGLRAFTEPELRAVATAAVREGRAQEVLVGGQAYRLIPLRGGRGLTPSALLALRTGRATALDDRKLLDVDPWLDVIRAAIEADLVSREELDGERHQTRALRGGLRFLRYLLAADSERALIDAMLQAAAIWFDVDVRLYRREQSAEYVLAAALPGAEISAEHRRLSGIGFAPQSGTVRLSALPEIRGLSGVRDGLLIPIAVPGDADWLLALIGTVPLDVDVTLEAVGRVFGAQMERLGHRQREALRCRFEDIVASEGRAPELTAIDVLRQVVGATEAGGAALWVQQHEGVRRFAAVGRPLGLTDGRLPSESLSTASRLVRTLELGGKRRARLELAASDGAPLSDAAIRVVDVAASVLRSWLPTAIAQPFEPMVAAESVADFVRRIDEELARAKRFDRRLALVLIESDRLGVTQSAADTLLSLLRQELRGSDVLGRIGRERVVALLIETDSQAVGTVVRRLRERIGHALPDLKVPALNLGQAAYSADCATADALLSRAAVNMESITLPA